MLRILAAQINPTVGDLAGNVRLMVHAATAARARDCQLVVFPELALTGYYPGDLLEDEAFLDRTERALDQLLQASRQMPGLAWVVGLPRRRSGPGKRLHNALLVLRGGEIVLQYAKQLLPTYGVFDERRHFEPGPDVARTLQIAGLRVGFLICEDGWNVGADDYALDPFERLRDAAPDLVVSINASPSHRGNAVQRHALFTRAAALHGLPLLYVNQVGGQDQLVYDGASFAVELVPQPAGAPRRARVAWQASAFETALDVIDFDGQGFTAGPGQGPLRVDALEVPEFYRRQIVLGIRDYARRCGFRDALVGCSGGIDSALTLVLAVQALGADHVLAVTMPSRISSPGSVEDSQRLCEALGVRLWQHPIAGIVDAFAREFEAASGQPLQGLALENLQARVRGTALMEISNTAGPLLLTTGNKSEVSVGYCTLYGDTNGGLAPIADLYKTEVFALAQHVNRQAGRPLIPREILDKPPSAELAPGQRDTDSLPPYDLLDEILKLHLEGHRLEAAEQAQASRVVQALLSTTDGQSLVRRIHGLVARNEYKRRQAPPVIRVRARAFGAGRQMPIAAVHTAEPACA